MILFVVARVCDRRWNLKRGNPTENLTRHSPMNLQAEVIVRWSCMSENNHWSKRVHEWKPRLGKRNVFSRVLLNRL